MERYSRLDKTYVYMWLTQWPIWRPADMEEYNVADMVDDMVANMDSVLVWPINANLP